MAGSTYRDVKGLLQRVIQNGYFDWKLQPEQPEPVPEPEQPEPVPEIVPQPEAVTFHLIHSVLSILQMSIVDRFSTRFPKN